MKTLSTIIFFIVCLSFQAKASELICQTNYNEIKLVIDGDNVAVMKTFERGREFASNELVKTQSTDNGFTKTFYKGTNKYKVAIADLKNLNEVDDYLTIVSHEGHQMTYPLNCAL